MHRWIHYSSDFGFRNFLTNVWACRHGPLHPSQNCERPLATWIGSPLSRLSLRLPSRRLPVRIQDVHTIRFQIHFVFESLMRSRRKPSLCDRHKNIPGLRIREAVAYTASGYVRRRASIQAQRSKERSGKVGVWLEGVGPSPEQSLLLRARYFHL